MTKVSLDDPWQLPACDVTAVTMPSCLKVQPATLQEEEEEGAIVYKYCPAHQGSLDLLCLYTAPIRYRYTYLQLFFPLLELSDIHLTAIHYGLQLWSLMQLRRSGYLHLRLQLRLQELRRTSFVSRWLHSGDLPLT